MCACVQVWVLRVVMYMNNVSASLYVAGQGGRAAGEESARGARDNAGRLAADRGKRRRKGGKWYDGSRIPAKASSSGAIFPQV